jgi:hypothetical protein
MANFGPACVKTLYLVKYLYPNYLGGEMKPFIQGISRDQYSGPKPINTQSDPDRLYAKIGQLNMELDWLKKDWAQPVVERQKRIEPYKVLAVSTQCKLLAVTRSVVYAPKSLHRNQWTRLSAFC